MQKKMKNITKNEYAYIVFLFSPILKTVPFFILTFFQSSRLSFRPNVSQNIQKCVQAY